MPPTRLFTVIGATGYIGKNLQRHAASLGDVDLVSLSREQFGMLTDATWVVESEQTGGRRGSDKSDTRRTILLSKIRNSAALINLAGAGRQSAKKPYEESVVGTTIRAVRLCQRAGIPRIVHLSGLGASARTPIAYLAAKYRAESTIRDSGLEYVILRPSYVVGRNDYLTRYVQRCRRPGSNMTEDAAVDVPGQVKSSRPIQPVHVCDAVRIILWGATAETKRHTLDLVGPDRITFYAYVSLLAKAVGGLRTRPIPFEEAYHRALRAPVSAPFGIDDLGIIAGGFVGDYANLCKTTKITPRSVLSTLKTGSLP